MTRKNTPRKCLCCKELFVPDYRNRKRQVHCKDPVCRKAAKAANQRRWLRSPKGRDYFRDAKNVERVQEWRKQHPGYWKKKSSPPAPANRTEPVDHQELIQSRNLVTQPGGSLCTLQDFCPPASRAQDPVLVGLISMFTGRTLQDEIAAILRQVIIQGENILGLAVPETQQSKTKNDLKAYDPKTPDPAGSSAAGSQSVQLG